MFCACAAGFFDSQNGGIMIDTRWSDYIVIGSPRPQSARIGPATLASRTSGHLAKHALRLPLCFPVHIKLCRRRLWPFMPLHSRITSEINGVAKFASPLPDILSIR